MGTHAGIHASRRDAGRARPDRAWRSVALVAGAVLGTSGCLGLSSGSTIESLSDPCGLLGRATVQRLVPDAEFTPPRVSKVTQCMWATPTTGPAAERPEPRELQLVTFVADPDTARSSLRADRAKAGADAGLEPLPGVGDEAFVVSSTENPISGRPHANADVHFRLGNVVVTVRYWITEVTEETAGDRIPSVRETVAVTSREVAANLAKRR